MRPGTSVRGEESPGGPCELLRMAECSGAD
jgi:hypothetical protein